MWGTLLFSCHAIDSESFSNRHGTFVSCVYRSYCSSTVFVFVPLFYDLFPLFFLKVGPAGLPQSTLIRMHYLIVLQRSATLLTYNPHNMLAFFFYWLQARQIERELGEHFLLRRDLVCSFRFFFLLPSSFERQLLTGLSNARSKS